MKKVTFLQGVGVAAVLSIGGGLLFAMLAPLFGAYFALRVVVTALSLAYVAYLLRASGIRIGRLTTLAVWAVVAMAGWFWIASSAVYLLLHVGLIWLIRACYLQQSVLAALADLGLAVLGAVAAASAMLQSGSLSLSLWCFFLLQALFVVIPSRWNGQSSPHTGDSDDRFQHAYRSAEAALRRISSV